MPAIDNLTENATHIPDRNEVNAVRTLCGAKKEKVAFYEQEANFTKATCKTCRRIFFYEEPTP